MVLPVLGLSLDDGACLDPFDLADKLSKDFAATSSSLSISLTVEFLLDLLTRDLLA